MASRRLAKPAAGAGDHDDLPFDVFAHGDDSCLLWRFDDGCGSYGSALR
jgi:hypothetical protein